MSDDAPAPSGGDEQGGTPADPAVGRPADRAAVRPRPEYGEYATPEEQRARMGLPPAHQAGSRSSPSSPAPPSTGVPLASSAPPGSRRADHTASTVPRTRPPRTWDRSLTWVLLALGLLSLATSSGSYLNMVPAMQAAYQELGIGHFGAADIARPAGVALVVVQTAIWVAAVLLATRSLRRGRISFWIPLVGAVVSYIALVAVLLIVVLNDPAFVAYITATHPH